MNLKKSLILFLFIFFTSTLSAQTNFSFQHAGKIEGDIANFKVDNLGNFYLLLRDGQLKKLSPAGDSIAVFNQVRKYGMIYSIDVTNPLKIILYYKDFGTVLLLDRLLNIRNVIDLRKLNLFQVKAVGLAYDNNIWVFDEQEAKLKHIREDGTLIDQSTDFRLIFDSLPSPQYISDENRLVYLYDTAKGVYVFDYYGALKNHIPLLHWKDFLVINKTIYGHDTEQFLKYEPGTLNLQQLKLQKDWTGSTRIRITPQKIYVLTKSIIDVYDIIPAKE